MSHVVNVFDGGDVRKVSGLSSGEGLIYALSEIEIVTSGEIIDADKRLWVTEGEFARVLKTMKREGNTLSAILRDAWDSGSLNILTKTNPLEASGCHVSITAHITREELSETLTRNDAFNGFANRFLWALVRRSKLLPDGGGDVPLDALRGRLRDVLAKATTIGRMQRSDDCSRLWAYAYPLLVSEKRGLWDAVTSRAEAQTLRLSMLYALLDGSPTIETDHLLAAIAVHDYCNDSARIIFGTDDGGTLERKIETMIRQSGPMTKTAIRERISSADRRHYTKSLSWLVDRRRLRVERIAGTETYSIPPNDPPPSDDPPPSPENDHNDQRPTSTPTEAVTPPADDHGQRPASVIELLDWATANGKSFVRQPDGTTWVTPVADDETIPPSITAGLAAHGHVIPALSADGESLVAEIERELFSSP